MRELVALGIIGESIAERVGNLAYDWLLGAEKADGGSQRSITDALPLHFCRLLGAILWIEAEHHQPVVTAGLQTRLPERIDRERKHGTA